MKPVFRKLLPVIVTILLFAATVALYSFLPLSTPAKYSSPDEAANALFSKLYAAQDGRLWLFDDFTIPTGGLALPRSFRMADGFLVPGSFIGLPVLFGMAGRLLTPAVIPFLTPVMAVLAAIAWGMLVRRRFGDRVGILAGLLLLVQPTWWYEASRTMQPNALFCALLIFAAYFFVAAPFRTMVERSGREGHRLLRASDAMIAGLFLGAALAVRTSEAYWIVLGIGTLALVAPRRTPWARLLVLLLTSAIAFAPFLALNNAIYGNYFATGYGAVTTIAASEAMQGRGNALLGPLRPYLFPLGFAPHTALVNAWKYGIAFFWWWTLLVAAGIYAYVRGYKKETVDMQRDAKAFGLASAVVTVWLVFFYGSWVVRDAPDPNAVSIGSSYLRYWLPAAVLSTLPVAWGLAAVSERLGERKRTYALAAAVAVVTVVSGVTVFTAKGEGLIAVRDAIRMHVAVTDDVIERTEQKAIIITDYDDKYLFPTRHVVVPLRSPATYGALQKLTFLGPLYYLGITLPDTDMQYLHDTVLTPVGLRMVPVKTYGEQTLYAIRKTDTFDSIFKANAKNPEPTAR